MSSASNKGNPSKNDSPSKKHGSLTSASKSSKSSKSKASASASGAKAKSHPPPPTWKMLDFDHFDDSSDSSDDDPSYLTAKDLMEDIQSQPEPKLTLPKSRRLKNLASGRDHASGFTHKLLRKLGFRSFAHSEQRSDRQSLRVSKLTKDVEHKYLTLTHVNVRRNKIIDSLVQIDEISYLYFILLDKIFQVDLKSTSAFFGSPAERRAYECATRVFMVDRSKSFRDKGHLICSLANIIQFNTSVVDHKSCRTLVPGESKRRTYDNSLIGEEYRVRENTDAAKNKESENIMTALLRANEHNTLELVSPDPADLGCILTVLVVRWRKFQAGDKHPGLDSRHLVDAMTHRRGDDMPPLLDDKGGGGLMKGGGGETTMAAATAVSGSSRQQRRRR